MTIRGVIDSFKFLFCDVFCGAFMRHVKGGFWGYRQRLQSEYSDTAMPAMYLTYLDKNCSYIGLGTQFASEPMMPHGLHGIHISNRAVIGRNCTIMQNVTIGSNTFRGSKRVGSPTIGDNVFIGANSTVIGNIHVGNNVRIGANTCVFTDIPDNKTVVSDASIRFIPRDPSDSNNFIGIDETSD